MRSSDLKLVSAEEEEHQRLLEARKGIHVPTVSKRTPMEIPSYEEAELNQVSPDDHYLNLPANLAGSAG